MGGGRKPGIQSRLEGGDEENLTGFAAIAKYGEGKFDSYTGRYESYNLPAGHPATRAKESSRPVEWKAILGQLDLLVSDFQDYGIDLVTDGLKSISWVRFEALVVGLMATDSRMGRFFAPKPTGQPKTRRSY